VFASHDRTTLERLCTRGLVFQSGNLIFDGTVPAAFDRYDELTGAALN
jgi:ABC-type polysaccharide/polyol phosphate transport system ATPase subunit